MSFLPRPLIGFSAAFLTMAIVVIAGLTATDAKPSLHASGDCRMARTPMATPAPTGT